MSSRHRANTAARRSRRISPGVLRRIADVFTHSRSLKLTAALAVLAPVLAPSASAGAANVTPGPDGRQAFPTPDEVTELPPIEVTGTYIAPTPGLRAGMAPLDSATAARIRELGTTDLLQTLERITPALTGNFNTGHEVNDGGFGESYAGIRNLRSLVLLNGRRLGNSSFSNGQLVDLNTIPLAAIERVEILKDGASALYGSEAVGGVINIITKREFSGLEIGGRYGVATGEGSAAEHGASMVAGWPTDRGWFMAAAQYHHRDPVLSTERDIAHLGVAELDARNIYPNGVSYLSPSFAGRIQDSTGTYELNRAAYTTPPVLPGMTFSGPTAIADYLEAFRAANPGAPDPYIREGDSTPLNTALFGTHVLQEQDRAQFFAAAEHQILEDRMKVFADFLYAGIRSEGSLAPSPVSGLGAAQANIRLPADNPYNPFGIDLGADGAASPRVRSRFVDLGKRVFKSDTDYFHVAGGLRGELEGDYGYEVAGTYNRYDQVQRTRNALNGEALDLSLRPLLDAAGQPVIDPVSGRPLSQLSDRHGPVPVYNLFSGGRLSDGFNDPRTLDAIRSTLRRTGTSDEWNLTAVVAGAPFELPAGDFRFASGVSVGSESLSVDFDPLTLRGRTPGITARSPTSGERDNWAVFVETRIPLAAPQMGIPGLHRLEVSASGRHEQFDPGGEATVPKVSVRWQPVDEQWTLRATYSRSFVAPTTWELFGGTSQSAPVLALPQSPGGPIDFRQEYTSNLSNDDLDAVDAENWGFGIVISPRAVRGLTLSVDYYRITTRNDIFRMSPQIMVDSINALGAASPWARYFTRSDGSRITTGEPDQANDADWGDLGVPLLNGARVQTHGIDFGLEYVVPTGAAGTFTLFANASLLLGFEYSDPAIGGPYSYDGLYTDASLGTAGAQGTLPDYIVNSGVHWEMPLGAHSLDVTLFAQYIPSVESPGTAHPANGSFSPGFNGYTWDGSVWTVDDWYRLDVQVSFELGRHRRSSRQWYDGTRLTVGCLNFTDSDPPLIAAAYEDNTDKSTYDILGRFVYFEISRSF